MKIVTMCFGGNVRSVGLKFLLHAKYGHDAIACGHDYNTPETRNMLFEWADYIVVMTADFAQYVPDKYRYKTFCYDVGEDRYHNPFHPELQSQCDYMIQKHGLFLKKD
jgi:predicted protein tyrosine phosphatase